MSTRFGYLSRLLALLVVAGPVLAQEEFSRDIVPTITFAETRFQNLRYDPEWEAYDVVYTTASASITAHASLLGVDLTAIDADTAFSIWIGDFSYEGVLGDSPGYDVGERTIVFPLDADGDDTNDGNFTIRYTEAEVTFTLNVNRDVDGAFSPAGLALEGSMYAPGEYVDLLPGSFGFADCAVADLQVYVVGTRVQTHNRTVAAGTDDEEVFEDLADIALKGASDDQPPTVAFEFPAAGAKVHASPQIVTLQASDDHEVASVQLQVNGGEWQEAMLQGNWTFAAPLLKGLNTLIARALDAAGNERITLARTLNFAPLDTLTVTAAGSGAGRITASFLAPLDYKPDQPSPIRSATREEDELLTFTAAPAEASIFEKWTANVPLTAAQASSPVLEIALTPDLALTAHFIPNPFLDLKGRFGGLLVSEDPSQRGFFRAKVNTKGGITATVRLGRRTLQFRGKLSSDGKFSGLMKSGSVFYNLTWGVATFGDGSVQLRGTLQGGGLNAELTAMRAEFDAHVRPAPQAGNYAVLLTPDDENSDLNYPAVASYGWIRVDRSGAARFVGQLGDGTRVSFGGALSKAGEWTFLATLYGKKGWISGTIIFPEVAEEGLSGAIDWFKPAGLPHQGRFASGFVGRSNLTGTKN